ncbi:unnamed protein product [Phytophthora fragariaefolia]|uniref:Unnamed protein product n=1 Tax=Phytophthora fragariaefolia TaxID=1490495 RepID=A0A9W6U0K5_9STRA|nr:unnamed protein product [Phytophthora fragariaefolia]
MLDERLCGKHQPAGILLHVCAEDLAKMAAGECQTSNRKDYENEEDELLAGPETVLDEGDIALLKTYGLGPYSRVIKQVEDDIKKAQQAVNDLIGIKESDTGLSLPSLWDLVSDKQMMQEEQPLQVARCTKIINAGEEDAKYMINVKQIAKFVVGLGEKVAPTDIEEGMRVGVDRTKYAIQIPLPPKIDPTVSLMTVEDKPDVTYDDVGGAKDALEKLREVVELPLLHPERFVNLGIDPPKGVLLYGPPGTGKTLSARAVANRTDACFIRVIGSELVQKYVGEGARMVRELFTMARSKKACIVFFDEVDAIGGARSSSEEGGTDNEVQRTMLQIVTELDGFDPRGNIKVLMATNRPDTLDPALMRPGRLDRKVEFNLPELEGRTQILKIHAKSMNCDRGIRFELVSRLCPNTTGAELRSVCTEAGMFAIRARRKSVSEKDFLESVNKVIKGYKKFSSTPNGHPAVRKRPSSAMSSPAPPAPAKLKTRSEFSVTLEVPSADAASFYRYEFKEAGSTWEQAQRVDAAVGAAEVVLDDLNPTSTYEVRIYEVAKAADGEEVVSAPSEVAAVDTDVPGCGPSDSGQGCLCSIQ